MVELNNILGDSIGSIEVIQQCGNDKMVANAARVSFGNDNELPLNVKDMKLISYLVKHKHTSPFEHNLLTVKVKLPLNIGEQWLRHRVGWSYNKESGRYINLEDAQFYIPLHYRAQAETNRQASKENGVSDYDSEWYTERVTNLAVQSVNLYRSMRNAGITKEQARMVLPQSLYMSMYATCNLNSLMHFVKLRDHEGAQWEMQQYAKGLKQIAEQYWPVSIGAMENTYEHN